MGMDKDPYKVTKAGLIRAGIISLVLIVGTFYMMYKSGVLPSDVIGLLICTIIGVGFVALSTFMGIKLGRKNYARLKTQFEETKKIKGIANFGVFSMIVGMMLLGKPNPVELLAGLVWMVAGLGLIMVKKFGRLTFIIIATISSLLIAIDFLSGNGIRIVNSIVSKSDSALPLLLFVSIRILLAVFCISGIYYFTRPKIKERFKKAIRT